MSIIDLIYNNKSAFTYIEGRNFYYIFLAGANNLIKNYAYLNKINVFPVPDGDTGTNMASTVQTIIDSVHPSRKLNVVLANMADAALEGSRGNSGIIVAQFIQGLSNELENDTKIDVKGFAKAVNNAVEYTYSALANPKEGTILTVLKIWGQTLIKLSESNVNDFITLVHGAYKDIQIALVNTKKQLKELSRANVVDAGAQGLVFFMKGMLDFAANADLKNLAGSRQKLVAKIEDIDFDGELTFRYCTEALALGEDIDIKALITNLETLGDSVVIAGNSNKIRAHVHTDSPQDAIKLIREKAFVQSSKVDDMLLQKEISNNRKSDVAILVDSSADISDELMWQYQIHSVPFKIQIGDNNYLDRTTITHDDFYTLLADDNNNPKTSLPSLKDIRNKMLYLATYYKAIIVLNISASTSGTWQTFNDAAKKIQEQTNVPIVVYDTGTIAGGHGLIAVRIAKALEKNVSFEDLTRLIPTWCKLANAYAMTKTIKYFVRGGRLSKFKGFIATLFGIVPVVTNDPKDGKATILFKARNQYASINKVMEHIRNQTKNHKMHSYCIEYSNIESKEVALTMIDKMRAITGKDPLYIMQATPVIGTHAGIGTVAIGTILK